MRRTSRDGKLYVVWSDGKSIVLAESHDGGKTFAPSHSIFETGPPVYPAGSGFPQVGVDVRPGKAGGRVYVCWSDYSNGDVDVFVASSADNGRTWSKAVRANTDERHDGIDQFFQWMAVDPVTGDVYVQFYDRREDPANRKTRMVLARSTDGGQSFTNYQWTSEPFESELAFLGDYTWLVAYNGKVYGAWAEAAPTDPASQTMQNGRPRGGTNMRVGTADFSGVK